MTEREDALLAELVDGLREGLPAEMGGREVDAEFNGGRHGDGPRRGLGVPGGGQEGAPAGGLAFSQTAV